MKRSTTVLAGALLAAAVLAGCGDDSKSGSSSGDYCAKIQAYKDKSDELDVVFTDTPDSAAVENAFTTMQTMINDLKSDAPSEIKDDVAKMSSSIDSIVSIFSKYDWDFIALASAPEFAELQEQLSGPEMQAASDRLQTYSEAKCGIVDDTTSS